MEKEQLVVKVQHQDQLVQLVQQVEVQMVTLQDQVVLQDLVVLQVLQV